MAGFDFKFPVPIEERDYAKALLRSAQIRARKTQLDFRFTWHNRRKSFPLNHYCVAINGDLLSIELFATQMLRFCEGFKEGYAANSQKFRKAQRPRLLLAVFTSSFQNFVHHLRNFQV
jgi:hypothetical protein